MINRWCLLSLLFFLLASIPGARQWWEASMSRHMGGQLPLLVLSGWLFALGLEQMQFLSLRVINYIKQYRLALIITFSFILAYWMIPLVLDAVLINPQQEALKFISLPITGLVLKLSWPRLGFVARGVLHMEALAMLLRLGWLYTITPERLCVNYGLADQRMLGQGMLIFALMYALWVGMRFFWGNHQLENKL